ncbi:nucleotidyltransferase family protein [Nitriliruptor alkaliphilus]|uniref:nucleotidyltransferase family protein n=1 Tax=Nitriliruptor alkaliphilus TaxID=427918 RepID=UPI0006972BE8|nr:nucleotidyltransferase family protein [Nitriliruptor alkaliphilus]
MVLAAGQARRFGATKQLAEVDGEALVSRVVAVAHRSSAIDEVHLVVGHDGAAVATAAGLAGPVTVVWNHEHTAGQATSLRAGIRSALGSDARVAVVLLADEPDVPPTAVDRVAQAVLGGASAARARYDDAPGHPVAFGRETFDRLLSVEGDRGARALLAELGVVEVPVAGPRPRDVDTPDDLARRGRR